MPQAASGSGSPPTAAGTSLLPRPSQGAATPATVACLAADPDTLAAALNVAAPVQGGGTPPAPSSNGATIGAAAGGAAGAVLLIGGTAFLRARLRARRRLVLQGTSSAAADAASDFTAITTLVVPGRPPAATNGPTVAVQTLNPITAALRVGGAGAV